MSTPLSATVSDLIRKGVRIFHPASVFVDANVNPDRIADDCVICPGCRLAGRETAIGPRCILGDEGPLNLDNCQLGAGVRLSGGHAAEATFLDRVTVGSGAHIRPGTLLEEDASAAHTVGFKQTILFPRVVTGSLINFCDCLMAGGTSRAAHSEVGSSYVHFNYTPRGDKATASLFGDVPRGVLLDQPPIFLGGQGGAVGPVRVDFGVFVPAGVILRRDVIAGHPPLVPGPEPAPVPDYPFGEYRSLDRIVRHGLAYAGNVLALRAWYRHVRGLFMAEALYLKACHQGALARLETIWTERLNRLEELARKAGDSARLLASRPGPGAWAELAAAQARFAQDWPALRGRLEALRDFEGLTRERDLFLAALTGGPRHGYLEAIAALPAPARHAATAWLQSIVDAAAATWPPPS
jgi:UDP-N-acetylglucosamine/UDP-N-acetylgalactosamine diphosphorylase